MIRSKCVICASDKLDNLYLEKRTPVSIGCSVSVNEIEKDIFADIQYVLCSDCGSAQIMNPVDRDVLYKESHNNTYNTPTWANHHAEFSQFILSSIEKEAHTFLEIGGSSGILAKKMLEANTLIEYSILDICNTNPNIEGVSFVNANCEEFTYTSGSVVLLSHVFEHLYNPLAFLERLSKAGVSDIFLSIPNMEVSLKNASISFLHVEHTFYIDSIRICNMFSKYKFLCKTKTTFKDHSFFFHFVKSDACSPLEDLETTNTKTRFRKYFQLRESVFQTVTIDKPFFFVPSGHFGQFMYRSLLQYREKMLGFLDNDPSKIGKRLYGTHLSVYAMNHIESYKGPLTIVLHAGPYIVELKKQLLQLNSSLDILEIQLPNNFN